MTSVTWLIRPEWPIVLVLSNFCACYPGALLNNISIIPDLILSNFDPEMIADVTGT